MKAERVYPRFTITAKGTRWVEGGHPWIYAQEIVSAPEGVENGALVDAVSEKGKYLGSGFFSRESKIRIRLLSRNANDRFDADFWRRRPSAPLRVWSRGRAGSRSRAGTCPRAP